MIGPGSSADEIIAHLKTLRNETNIAGMARFGIETETALGISNNDLRAIARIIKRDHERALDLWASNIREARILATYTEEPKKLTLEQARFWALDFNSWELVDSAAVLFVEARLLSLIPEFAVDEREFVRRMAFSMIAMVTVHMKKEPDETLLAYLPLIETYSTDPRNFVKKAVNWALRQIGKRNADLYGPALELSEKLAECTDKTARWIGKDAVKELINRVPKQRK